MLESMNILAIMSLENDVPNIVKKSQSQSRLCVLEIVLGCGGFGIIGVSSF